MFVALEIAVVDQYKVDTSHSEGFVSPVASAKATALLAFGLGIVLETQLSITWKAEKAPMAHKKNANSLAPTTDVDMAMICPTAPSSAAPAM